MKKIKVLIASRLREAAQAAADLLAGHPRCDVDVRIIANGNTDVLRGQPVLPDLLLLCNVQADSELQTLTETPAEQRPALVVFGPGQDAESIRVAMRAGARDYLTLPLDRRDLLAHVDKVIDELAKKEVRQSGRLHVFINGKGGSGATFLATNVAHGLAVADRRVTVVDLDLQFAGLCRYLDLTPGRDLIEAARSVDDMDELSAQAFTNEHDSGLRLLSCKSDSLHLNSDVPPDRMVKLLQIYQSLNDFVIVDMPRHIDLMNAAVLENADRISVVSQQSFPHLHDSARLMHILRNELGIDESRLTVIVNRYDKKSPILLDDVEKALRVDNLITIPNQYRMTSESVNSGIPLSDITGKSAVTRGLRDYYMSFIETENAAGKSGGALQRLFRRS
jgi:pilus assembly protein CpaE